MIGWLVRLFTGDTFGKISGAVDKYLSVQADKDKVKGEIIAEHYRTRPSFMQAGGFWLMLVFALPLAFWWAAVLFYSVFWCMRCAYPQTWSIAALPAPLDEWAGLIIIAIFGVIGVTKLSGRG